MPAGNDADLVFIDMDRKKQISSSGLHSKAGWTPYGGFDAIFPEAVMLRGDIVLDGKDFYGKRGAGQFIPGKGYEKSSYVREMSKAGKKK